MESPLSRLLILSNYLSFNSLKARVISLLTVYYNGEAFRNESIRNKSCLCLLTDRDEMSNIYRGPSIDASYHVSVHLAKRFHRRRFKKIDQSETRIAYGRFLKIFSSVTAWPHETKLGRKHL
jgi:hypothetical protein